MDKELKEIIDKIDQRLTDLENAVFNHETKQLGIKKANYKGLAGGLRLLLDNGFFDQPRSIDEIIIELNKKGYYNTRSGVASTLLLTFCGKKRALTRLKIGRKLTYVKRK
ncbi:MAG: hypothetical protein JRN68_06920 [Nitrososphaerota archaeon]|nr:hypothetical protein [Nitrososphaerota archaeon]